ncbi:3-methyl-2-oxobutanoate hydroxymethyltransferase [Symmachiella dynata]|uniref:3-methyl-2-oxobutanoate hydroxymethyltransferase n=1 Tax=Symmachiella dynata TaxID=2527995 RepID=UPI0030EBC08F|tara:strand:- start:520 stop:1344 length:825 start_codon:yes stop_codon:yes gene_type:complete
MTTDADNGGQPASPWTVPQFSAAKQQGRKLTVLTAYDFTWAQLLDEIGIDAILVGDTLGMVVQGRNSTLRVTVDQMIYHAEMVVRAVKQALVIVDMPFMSFHVSPEQAMENAGRLIKETGAAAVKLEGGVNQAGTIAKLTGADVPVMAHVGLKPQSVLSIGGYKVQRAKQPLLDDALAAQKAGAFAIVLECVPREIAAEITATLTIPTIGIGAGPDCDGQVLVTNDMLGLTPGFTPKFLKKYADLRNTVETSVRNYIQETRDNSFPDDSHSFHE